MSFFLHTHRSDDGETTTIPVFKNLLLWLVAALAVFLFWRVSSRIQRPERYLIFSDFVNQVEKGNVARVTISGSGEGSTIVGELENGEFIRTDAPRMEGLVETMLERGVAVSARSPDDRTWVDHLIAWTPIVVVLAVFIFIVGRVQPGGAQSHAARREKRVQTKARIFAVVSSNEKELSEKEIVSALGSTGPAKSPDDVRTALYEMLSDGIVDIDTGLVRAVLTTGITRNPGTHEESRKETAAHRIRGRAISGNLARRQRRGAAEPEKDLPHGSYRVSVPLC